MLTRAVTAVAVAFALPLVAQAQTTKFSSKLSGDAEVPATASAGTGAATLTLDKATKTLTYSVDYSGLSGPVGAAHIHGPAEPGVNAPPVIPITVTPSPIKGTATLTDAQITELEAGRYYINLHTAQHRPGEIRGQIAKAE